MPAIGQADAGIQTVRSYRLSGQFAVRELRDVLDEYIGAMSRQPESRSWQMVANQASLAYRIGLAWLPGGSNFPI